MAIEKLDSGEHIKVRLFGKEKEVEVFLTEYDRKSLSDEEIACLNWLVENVDLSDYRKEITAWCNEQYNICCETVIREEDLESELDIFAIAVNVTGLPQSNSGFVYPEISFFGDCKCDEEHGICIGFRDRKFLGVDFQDWTL